jgi:hypothetical protein
MPPRIAFLMIFVALFASLCVSEKAPAVTLVAVSLVGAGARPGIAPPSAASLGARARLLSVELEASAEASSCSGVNSTRGGGYCQNLCLAVFKAGLKAVLSGRRGGDGGRAAADPALLAQLATPLQPRSLSYLAASVMSGPEARTAGVFALNDCTGGGGAGPRICHPCPAALWLSDPPKQARQLLKSLDMTPNLPLLLHLRALRNKGQARWQSNATGGQPAAAACEAPKPLDRSQYTNKHPKTDQIQQVGLVELPPVGALVPSTPLRSTALPGGGGRDATAAAAAAAPQQRRKTLIFTSAGDLSDWMSNFLCHQREYDVFVTFYGDSADKRAQYAAAADRLFDIKGSKFQNLVRPEILIVAPLPIFGSALVA